MRQAAVDAAPTLGEIEKAVREQIREENIPAQQHRWFIDRTEAERQADVHRALVDTEKLGLVTLVNGSREPLESQRWRVAETWQPPTKSDDDDVDGGSDGGGRFGTPGGGGGDNQGGGGITEVLSHPILFSLDEEAFEGVVTDLFPNERS